MGHATRIVVVDDEEAIRRIATLGLEHAGYEVLATDDPLLALEALQDGARPVHLVLLDLSMPVMPGAEVYRRIRTLWDGPVLFHSGYRRDHSLTHELSDPRTDFLAKPWTLTELTSAVERILGRSARG